MLDPMAIAMLLAKIGGTIYFVELGLFFFGELCLTAQKAGFDQAKPALPNCQIFQYESCMQHVNAAVQVQHMTMQAGSIMCCT